MSQLAVILDNLVKIFENFNGRGRSKPQPVNTADISKTTSQFSFELLGSHSF